MSYGLIERTELPTSHDGESPSSRPRSRVFLFGLAAVAGTIGLATTKNIIATSPREMSDRIPDQGETPSTELVADAADEFAEMLAVETPKDNRPHIFFLLVDDQGLFLSLAPFSLGPARSGLRPRACSYLLALIPPYHSSSAWPRPHLPCAHGQIFCPLTYGVIFGEPQATATLATRTPSIIYAMLHQPSIRWPQMELN